MLIPFPKGRCLFNSAGEFFGGTRVRGLNDAQTAVARLILQGGFDLHDIARRFRSAWAQDPDRALQMIRYFAESCGEFLVGEWTAPADVDIVLVDRGWQGVYQHAIDLWQLLSRDYRAVLIAPNEPPYGFDPALEPFLVTPRRLGGEEGSILEFASLARTLMLKLRPRLGFLSHRALLAYFFDIAPVVPLICHGDRHFEMQIAAGRHMNPSTPLEPIATLQDILFGDGASTRDYHLTAAIASYHTSLHAKELWMYTEDERAFCASSVPELSEKTRVVLPMVDADTISAAEGDGQEPVILFTTTNLGRQVGIKGLTPLVQVFGDLPPSSRLRIVLNDLGDVPAELRAFGPRLELLERVPKSQMASIYRTSRVYCRLSKEESSPVSVMEAMAAGLPVMVSPLIARNIPLIQHGINGFVIDPDDLDAVSRHLRFILENPGVRARMGRSAREAVLPHSYQSRRWMFDAYLGAPAPEAAFSSHG